MLFYELAASFSAGGGDTCACGAFAGLSVSPSFASVEVSKDFLSVVPSFFSIELSLDLSKDLLSAVPGGGASVA